MKKLMLCFVVAAISVLLFSCKNSTNTAVTDEERGIQIDPQLQELGELNVKLLDYDEIDIPQKGVIPVKKGGKWGLVAMGGKEILPCLYKEVSYGGQEDVWIVRRNDSIGIVDNKGKFINELTSSFKSYTCLGKGLLHAIYNDAVEHQYIIPMKYNGEGLLGDVKSVTPFYDDVILVEYFGNYKLYSYTGDSLVAISSDYQHYTEECGEGLYCVTNGFSDSKYGFINSKGEVAVPFEFDKPCGVFSDGMATYSDSIDNVGFIDRQGKIVIPAQYSYAEKFSDGLAYVTNEEVMGFIDKSGKLLIDTKNKFSSGGGFIKGFCSVVGVDIELMGIINKKGETVVPIEYVINALSDDMYVACTSGENPKYGAFTYDGKQSVPFEFDDLSDFHNGWALAKIGDINLVVNKEGKTGILNLEEVLAVKKEQIEQAKKAAQPKLEESIKKQIVELLNESQGWEVLSSPSSVWNLEKVSEGMYKAEYMIETKYEKMDYELRNIEVDENGKVLGFDNKRVGIRPKANKPEGTSDFEEIIDRMTGRIRRK